MAIVMCVPAAVDAAKGNPDWQVFAMSAAVTLFFGVAMAPSSRSGMLFGRLEIFTVIVLFTRSFWRD